MVELPQSIFNDADISASEFRLYAQLVYLSRKKMSFPQVEIGLVELADACNLSRKTVGKHLTEMSERGLIQIETRNSPVCRGRLPNLYTLKGTD